MIQNRTELHCAGALAFWLIAGALMLSMTGCIGGIRQDSIVKAPDAPMLIRKVDGRVFRVSMYDAETNTMVEYPEAIHVTGQLEGWSLMKYDWDELIQRKANSGE